MVPKESFTPRRHRNSDKYNLPSVLPSPSHKPCKHAQSWQFFWRAPLSPPPPSNACLQVSQVLREGRVPRGPRDNPLVQAVYSDLVGGGAGESRARDLLHTSYHNVPKLELSNPHMSPW